MHAQTDERAGANTSHREDCLCHSQFMFGFLKFFQPISGWFDVQIQQSHLPREAMLMGKVTEMIEAVENREGLGS